MSNFNKLTEASGLYELMKNIQEVIHLCLEEEPVTEDVNDFI
jgi:predicted RNase H-like HicB family nuclease